MATIRAARPTRPSATCCCSREKARPPVSTPPPARAGVRPSGPGRQARPELEGRALERRALERPVVGTAQELAAAWVPPSAAQTTAMRAAASSGQGSQLEKLIHSCFGPGADEVAIDTG